MDKEDLWVLVVVFIVCIPLCYVTNILKQKYRSSCTTMLLKVKVKVMFTLQQATTAQRGSRGITLLFL